MCAHKHELSSSPQSEEDYSDILLYSINTWGVDQAREYKHDLDAAVNSIVDFPQIGVTRETVGAGIRWLHVRHHIIYYRIARRTVRILRILHQRQRTADQFDDVD